MATDDQSQSIDTTAPVAPKLVTSSAFNFLVDPQITMQTNLGTVVFELNPEQAPITVANMLAYVDVDFYDDMLFHRVIPGFMVQGGGFDTTGMYNPPIYDAITLESDIGLSNVRGTIAMARTSEADSATTQFFVNHTDNTSLDYNSSTSPGYAAFGEVVSGLSVIDDIAQVPTTTMGSYENVPVTAVVINSIEQTLSGSSITNAGTLQVSDLELGAQWSFSLDGGVNWSIGSGSSFVVPEGDYAANAIQVRQADAAGNVSVGTGKLTSVLEVDTTAPIVSIFTPADVAISSNIVVTFSEEVLRGTGNIVLKTGAGEIVATYDAATSSNLSLVGDTLTINHGVGLIDDTQYQVQIAAGSIKDLAGNGTTGNSSFGTSGDDILSGLAGNDNLAGGDGNDTVKYSGDSLDYLVLEDVPGRYIVIDLEGSDTDEGRDILTEMELLQFGSEHLPIAEAISNLQIIDDDAYYWDSMIGLPNGDTASTGEAQLFRTYFGAMQRTPDDSGYSWWLNEIDQGNHDLRSMAAGFIWSEEFLGYVNAPDGNSIPNDGFLTHMYEGVFGRAPDGDGYNWWLNELESGSRNQVDVLVDMTQSNEYVELTVTGVVDYLYGVAEFA